MSENNKLASINVDNYALFTWRGEESEKYGVFIINNGDDLQWHPYRKFNNDYSSPLYKQTRNLLGVSFESKIIELKLGAYNITAEEFREIVNWLDPLVIDKLSFRYDENWYYNVKISDFSTVTKYVIGNNKTENLYYAEFNISFETQDEGCAYFKDLQEFQKNPSEGSDSLTWTLTGDFVPSEEPTGIIGRLNLHTDDSETHYCELSAIYDNKEIILFNLNFKYKNCEIDLIYNSEKRSLLFNDRLVSTVSVDNYGNKIVEGYNVYSFLIPGTMKSKDFNYSKLRLKLTLKGITNTTDGKTQFFYLPKKLLI